MPSVLLVKHGDIMRNLYLALVIILTVALVVFAAQNLQPITVRFFGASATFPMAFWAILLYIAGALTGGGLYGLIRYSYRQARLRQHGMS